MSVPSLVSLKEELDMDLAFADLGLSFLLSGEERLTERMRRGDRRDASSDSLNGISTLPAQRIQGETVLGGIKNELGRVLKRVRGDGQ